jgi:hypothetical protein
MLSPPEQTSPQKLQLEVVFKLTVHAAVDVAFGQRAPLQVTLQLLEEQLEDATPVPSPPQTLPQAPQLFLSVAMFSHPFHSSASHLAPFELQTAKHCLEEHVLDVV